MSKKLINGKILSIQLGREETRIVLVGKNSEILHGITVPTPAGAVEDGMIHDQEAISAMLKEALETPEFKGVRQAVFSLCTSQVILETATTPDLPKAKLEKLIQANADMYFPVDIQDYRLVWEVVDVRKNDSGAKEAAVQLWAVPNEMLRGYYQAANACGLSVAAIDYCGHSAATAVGATFARPAKPPKAKAPKAPKDPEVPQEPKPKKKIDWNAEITFGRKKKVEPEVSQNEEAGPREIPGTDMHILMDKELLGLTFVQKGQVVYQRFYRCGSDPTYQFGELAMMVEYFQNQEIGRGSEIRGYVSGPGSMDPEMVELLSGMVGIPLEIFQSGMDQCWLLCAGAARTTLEFGNPDFNKAVRVRRTINTDLWQYAAILASGAALVAVVLMLLNSRLGWNAEISQLENTRDLLQIQSAQVNGFKENYDNYETEYAAYDRDWDALFNSLHTYNDNLVFVLEELENVMPANTSVTDIIIDSDSVMISFACDDKEEAAYLIMSLRDMEYVDVNTISNLIGGGKGAATDYGTPIEEVMPPTEGGTLEKLDTYYYSPYVTVAEMNAMMETYGIVPGHKTEHPTLAAFLNRHPLTAEERVAVVKAIIDTNPYAAKKVVEEAGYSSLVTEKTELSTLDFAVDQYREKLNTDNLEKAEALLTGEEYLNATYIHYLEASIGLWGQVDSFENYCPYVNAEKVAELKTLADPQKPQDYQLENWGAYWLNEWIDGSVLPDTSAVNCVCCLNIHTDADNNEKCDLCGADVCDHSPEKHTHTYMQTGTTTHAIVCDCGKAIEANVPCTDNGSGKCDCGRNLCKHDDTETKQVQGKRAHNVVCCKCGEVTEEDVSCVPLEDGFCICGRDMTVPCDHETDIILPNTPEKGKHTYTCDCGEVTSQEECIDKDPEDQVCDICKGEVPAPEVKPDDSPINRIDIAELEKVYGQVPVPAHSGDLASFLDKYEPTDYEREAALINLLEKNAFATNSVIKEAGPMIGALTEFDIKEDEPFKTVELAIATLKQKLKDNLAYLSVIENQISESEDEGLEQIYIYYLERAISDNPTLNTLPHLRSEPKEGSEVTERIEKTLAYVKEINGGSLMEPRIPPFETLMLQYLLDDTDDIDSEILAQLESYFNDEKVSAEFENDFKIAVSKESERYLDVPELLQKEFDSQYYHKESLGYKNLTKLYNNYRKNLIKDNKELLLVLQQSEQEAENAKDRDQDEILQEHEKEIEDLKKELEALKKAEAEKEKEEEGAAGGGGGGYRDTRVFLDIGLLYTEELWDQELQRKGLDRDAKIPKLEVEVG